MLVCSQLLVNPNCKYLCGRQTITKLRLKSSQCQWDGFLSVNTDWWTALLWSSDESYYQVMTDYDSEGHDTDTETNISGNVSLSGFQSSQC